MGGPLEEALVRFEVGTRLADLDETRMLRPVEMSTIRPMPVNERAAKRGKARAAKLRLGGSAEDRPRQPQSQNKALTANCTSALEEKGLTALRRRSRFPTQPLQGVGQ